MAPKVLFEFTECTVAEADRIATKRITPTETIAFDRVTWWHFKKVRETSLEGMARRLQGLALQPSRMIVMGAPVASLDPAKRQRRLWANSAVAATLWAPDRAWLPLDLDDVVVPQSLGRPERLREAARFIRDRLLTDEFRGARMIVTATAGSGRRGDKVARLRVFAALSRTHPIAALRGWAKGAAATLDLPIDIAVIQAGQPIYTPRPVFDGVVDPVPIELHAFILDGDRDTVDLNADRFAPKLAAIDAKIERVNRACGSDWTKLLDLTVGGDEGFFIPLTRSIGVAVRARAPAGEIQAAVARVLAERADADRQKRYGAAWVRHAIDSFTTRDNATRAAAARAHARLFSEQKGRQAWTSLLRSTKG
jgi:hypothetical protein